MKLRVRRIKIKEPVPVGDVTGGLQNRARIPLLGRLIEVLLLRTHSAVVKLTTAGDSQLNPARPTSLGL